jgi:protein TonB
MKVFLRPFAALFMVVIAYGAETPDVPREADNQVLVVSSTAIREAAVTKQEPEYPAAARQFRLSGEVVAEFTVGMDGKIESVSVTRGSPIFSDSVIKALRRWSFSPIKVDGRVRRVKSTLKFQFQL